jgi:hypothetical protein
MAVAKIRFDSADDAQQWLDDEKQNLIDSAVSDINDPELRERAESAVSSEFQRWVDRNSPTEH